MRLFIAILPENEITQCVVQVQTAFRQERVRGNYIAPENLHVTLAFIGEFHDPDAVLAAMRRVSFAPFSVTLDHIGCFDDLWWAGFAESRALDALAQKLRRALADVGIPFDKKRFRAHMTFLRRAEHSGKELRIAAELKPAHMEVGGISLMLSTRGKNGMIYTELGYIAAQQ